MSGGIGAMSGTHVSITLTNFNIDNVRALGNNGGGFYLTNTGTTYLSITTGNIASYSRAALSGGFLY